jgi:hypothetical protein
MTPLWLPASVVLDEEPAGPQSVARGQPRGTCLAGITSCERIGFGLGSVMLDPARAHVMGSPGEYAWGGVASTIFWIDDPEELIGMMLTHLVPSSTFQALTE